MQFQPCCRQAVCSLLTHISGCSIGMRTFSSRSDMSSTGGKATGWAVHVCVGRTTGQKDKSSYVGIAMAYHARRSISIHFHVNCATLECRILMQRCPRSKPKPYTSNRQACCRSLLAQLIAFSALQPVTVPHNNQPHCCVWQHDSVPSRPLTSSRSTSMRLGLMTLAASSCSNSLRSTLRPRDLVRNADRLRACVCGVLRQHYICGGAHPKKHARFTDESKLKEGLDA
jgi:hypothetical protein